MKANELRIGNLVRLREHDAFIQIEQYQLCESELINVQPIPLTEEWLLKFGFDDLGTYGYGRGNFHICLHENEFYFSINNRKVFIKHVHQLQNLYFALTGEELTYGGNK